MVNTSFFRKERSCCWERYAFHSAAVYEREQISVRIRDMMDGL